MGNEPTRLYVVLEGYTNLRSASFVGERLPDWHEMVSVDILGWDDPAIAWFCDRLPGVLPAVRREVYKLSLRWTPLITLRGGFAWSTDFTTAWQSVRQLLCEVSLDVTLDQLVAA
jgi:hypothetical protein